MWLYLFIFRVEDMVMCTLCPLSNSEANYIYINLEIGPLKELSSSAPINCCMSQSCIS